MVPLTVVTTDTYDVSPDTLSDRLQCQKWRSRVRVVGLRVPHQSGTVVVVMVSTVDVHNESSGPSPDKFRVMTVMTTYVLGVHGLQVGLVVGIDVVWEWCPKCFL